MHNIRKIFLGDLAKLKNNVVACIMIMGLAILPSLYAWFNIAASWDPYENTKNIKIAVANTDKGYSGELLPMNLNIGEKVTGELRKNTKMNWVFTTKADAIDGVKSGEYYAAIVIPTTFSDDMMSIFDNNVRHSSIIYYVNEKRNAIAPKVTDKGASSVKQSVDQSFISTIVNIELNLLKEVSKMTGGKDTKDILVNLMGKLQMVDANVNSASAMLDSMSTVTGDLANIMETTSKFMDTTTSAAQKSSKNLKDSKKQIATVADAVNAAASGMNDSLTQMSEMYDQMAEAIDAATSNENVDKAVEQLSDASTQNQQALENNRQLLESLKSTRETTTDPAAQALLDTTISNLESSIAAQEKLQEDLDAATSDKQGTAEQIEKSRDDLKKDSQASREAMEKLKNDYADNWQKTMDSLVKSLNKTMDNASQIMGGLSEMSGDAMALTNNKVKDLRTIHKLLASTARSLKQSDAKLKDVINALQQAIDSDDLSILQNILNNDPDTISQFLAAPVDLNKISEYKVENYGSAMTPFYSVLAIWVGAVVLCAMLKTNLTRKRIRELENLRHYQAYFGRYILFGSVGVAQAILICAGDLFYLGIQCKHPFLFILTGIVTSLVFTSITYSLTLSFGDVGKAAAVILMVLQVAGSGGTFPVEMMPKIFQIFYPFEPFVYGMNAMRECIAGFYGNDYWKYMFQLCLFLIPALILGLVLRNPIIKLNHWFEEKLESSKVM